jgi:hypothetical protein
MKYLMLLLIMRATYECGTTSTVIGAGVSVATSGVNKHNKYGIAYGVGSQVGVMLPLVEIMKPRRIK